MKEVTASTIKAERLQTRANTDSEYVDEIAIRMKAGDIFPPIVIFTNGRESWLPDGIHRLDGAIQAKCKISVDERKGSREDAVEFGCGANIAHGLRRTKADKRRSVTLALSTFPDRSSRAIADLCGVSNHLVDELRQANSTGSSPSCTKKPEKTRVGRDGKRRPAQKQPTEKAAPTEGNGKPPKPGEAKGDPRLWERWEDLFGKLRRLADDLGRSFPHSNNHRELVSKLNSAHATVQAWKKQR